MSDIQTTDTTEQAPQPEAGNEPAPGLYIFYDDNREVQIGVSGDYTIAEAVLILSAAKSKLELLQYHAFRAEQERTATRSNIVIPQ